MYSVFLVVSSSSLKNVYVFSGRVLPSLQFLSALIRISLSVI